jgi:hypothetical protein
MEPAFAQMLLTDFSSSVIIFRAVTAAFWVSLAFFHCGSPFFFSIAWTPIAFVVLFAHALPYATSPFKLPTHFLFSCIARRR